MTGLPFESLAVLPHDVLVTYLEVVREVHSQRR